MTCSRCHDTGRQFYRGSDGDVEHDVCDCQLEPVATHRPEWTSFQMADGNYGLKCDGVLVCSGLSKSRAEQIAADPLRIEWWVR